LSAARSTAHPGHLRLNKRCTTTYQVLSKVNHFVNFSNTEVFCPKLDFPDSPFVKLFALRYRTVVCLCLSVSNVGVLWPNGWMD